MMDNRMFNINGQGSEMLLEALRLAFLQSGHGRAEGYISSQEKGLIITWSHSKEDDSEIIPFPASMTPEQVLNVVESWLASPEAEEVYLEDDEKDMSHDGHNTIGWKLYCEGWGHVGSCRHVIIAIKPCHLWHGK